MKRDLYVLTALQWLFVVCFMVFMAYFLMLAFSGDNTNALSILVWAVGMLPGVYITNNTIKLCKKHMHSNNSDV